MPKARHSARVHLAWLLPVFALSVFAAGAHLAAPHGPQSAAATIALMISLRDLSSSLSGDTEQIRTAITLGLRN